MRGFLGLEDGGLIGYLEGGLTGSMGSGGQDNEENLSNIEEMLGFELTPQQEALFQARDTSAITRGAEQLGQGLLGMTGGQGLASAGTGFGAGQSAISQAVEGMQQSYDQGIADEAKAFESQVKGTAADLIAGGAEYKNAGLHPPTTTPSGVASFGKVETGPDGRQYIWLGDDRGWNFVGDL